MSIYCFDSFEYDIDFMIVQLFSGGGKQEVEVRKPTEMNTMD